MGKSDDKKDLRKEVEMNEHTDSIAQVEQLVHEPAHVKNFSSQGEAAIALLTH